MENNKRIKVMFWLALSSSVMLGIGIPMIPIFIVAGNWFLAVVGIIFTLYGFYGCPFYWIGYASSRELRSIIETINIDHIYNVNELSSHLQMDKKLLIQNINKIIKKRYLVGFIFDGENLTINENERQKKTYKTIKCDNCGGELRLVEQDMVCPYCGKKMIKSDDFI